MLSHITVTVTIGNQPLVMCDMCDMCDICSTVQEPPIVTMAVAIFESLGFAMSASIWLLIGRLQMQPRAHAQVRNGRGRLFLTLQALCASLSRVLLGSKVPYSKLVHAYLDR